MKLHGEFLPDKSCQRTYAYGGKFSDGMDSVHSQLLFRLLAHPKQLTHIQRPHFLLHLLLPQRMHLVRLLEFRCHLCKKLVGPYTDIHRKSKLFLYLILQPRGHIHRIFPPVAHRHVNEALIYRKLLKYR